MRRVRPFGLMLVEVALGRLTKGELLGGGGLGLGLALVLDVERINTIGQKLTRRPGTFSGLLQIEGRHRAEAHHALFAAQLEAQDPAFQSRSSSLRNCRSVATDPARDRPDSDQPSWFARPASPSAFVPPKPLSAPTPVSDGGT